MTVQLREIVSACIATILILTYCLAVLFDIVNGKPYSVPDTLLAIVVLVTGFYFGQHASTNGAYAAGAVAAQAAATALTTANATDVKPTP